MPTDKELKLGQEQLSVGLRHRSDQPTNAAGLTQFQNQMVRSQLVLPYESMTCPFESTELTNSSVTIASPFPQLFRGSGVTILATSDKVFTVAENYTSSGAPTWNLTQPSLFLSTATSAECVTNGTFGSTVPWWDNTGFTISSSHGWATGWGADILFPQLTQYTSISSAPFVDGERYYVTADVNVYQGWVRFQCGSAGTYTYMHDSGRYKRIQRCSGSLQLIVYASSDFSGTVANISALHVPTGSVTASCEPWQFVDMGTTWLLVREAEIVGTFSAFSFINKKGLFNCGCQHRGRILYGGWSGSPFSSDVTANIEALGDNRTGSLGTISLAGNMVYWGLIGGGDALWVLLEYLAEQGPLKAHEDYEYFQDMLDRGDLGWSVMPTQGTVRAVKGLGKGFVAYTDDAAHMFEHYTEPRPHYGLVGSISAGIASRCAIGGDDTQHIYVDARGRLWRITADWKHQCLEYEEFFGPMVGTDIVVSYDAGNGEFYIANADSCYLLSANGALSKLTEVVTSCVWLEGGTVGIAETASTSMGRITTDAFDLGSRLVKTIHSVDLGHQATSSTSARPWISLDYRFSPGSSWSTTELVQVNDAGMAVLMAAGSEFRLNVESTYWPENRIGELTIHWGGTGKVDTTRLLV